MKKCCGNCKQFERQSGQTYDLCGAWGNPTHADRVNCDFWMNLEQVLDTDFTTEIFQVSISLFRVVST
jgi:hypothetical protein